MGRLFIVATPIGNLEDITLRALRVLGEADLVLAEDTRRVRALLERHAVSARPVSLHAHNEAARTERALAELARDGRVALVSDAGTPLVSDPGERLVSAAIGAGHEVLAVPGASAPIAALSVSGLPARDFTFVGFLPRRAGACEARLGQLRDRPETLVLFESPRRLAATLGRLRETLGDRRACVARELTKLHEEASRGRLSELALRFAEGARGEVTIVVEGAEPPPPASEAEVDAAIREHLASGASARDTATAVARTLGVSRRSVYSRVLALQGDRAGC